MRDGFIADLCDCLTPSTLVAVFRDLSNETEYPVARVRQLVRQALEANVGEVEAEEMIWNATHPTPVEKT